MNIRLHLQSLVALRPWSRVRRWSIVGISLLSLCSSFILFGFPSSNALAQTPPFQTQQDEATQLLEKCYQLSAEFKYEQMLDICPQALEAARTAGDRKGEILSLINLGDAYLSLGEYSKAIDSSEQALHLSKNLDDRKGEILSLINLGDAYLSLGEYSKAIDSSEQALHLSKNLGDRQGEVRALINLGAAYWSLGEYSKAIDSSEQALHLSKELGDRQREVRALINLGLASQTLGEYPKAISSYRRSLNLSRELGDRQGETHSLMGLGDIFRLLGQDQKALIFSKRALDLSRELGDQLGVANSLTNLGNAFWMRGKYPEAIFQYERALRIFRELGNRRGEANSLNNLGNVYNSLGEYSKAIDYNQQSLHLSQEIGDRQVEINSLNNLGNAYLLLGEYPKAADHYKESINIARNLGDRQGEARALSNLGYALYIASPVENEAEPYLRQAIEILESLRANLSDPQKLALFEILTSPYYTLQWVLANQGHYNEALEIAERGRARAFVELLAQRLAPEAAQSLAESQATSPITFDQIKQVARDQNATLVEYSLAADDRLYIWVIPPDGETAFRWLDLGSLENSLPDLAIAANDQTAQGFYAGNTTLSMLVQETRSAMGTAPHLGNDSDSDVSISLPPTFPDHPRAQDGLQQLYELLIDPIQDLLPSNPEDHVIFVPQRELYLVPFAALKSPEGSYLIADHTIRIAPSIQVLHLTYQQRQQRQQALRKALIVGNPTNQLPPLPNAEQEAKAIARIFNTRPLIGKEATSDAVIQRMPDAHLIHLAAHASPNGLMENDGAYGGLVFLADTDAGPTTLTTNDILEMQLQAELVVLSGCNTGVSNIINSDGVVGLARSIMAAGSPSVIISLWPVPDTPTAALMQKFYRYWNPVTRFRRLEQILFLMGVGSFGFLITKTWNSRLQKGRSPNQNSAAMQWKSRLKRHWGLAIGSVSVAILIIFLQAVPASSASLDKAQALRQAMLSTMETHPDPKDWAAFTLMGEAQ